MNKYYMNYGPKYPETTTYNNYETYTPQHITSNQNFNKPKRSKKVLIPIIIIVICIALALALLYPFIFNSKKGLVPLDEIEEKLNVAISKVFPNIDIVVSNYEVKNVDEETHDQVFRCDINELGLRVIGVAKDGQVIQIQSILLLSYNEFINFDTDVQAAVLSLPIFPISIFEENIDTIEEFANLLRDMKTVNALSNGDSKIINSTTNENIEYTYMGGSILNKTAILYAFNIRYLPAFNTSFFDKDYNNVMDEYANKNQIIVEEHTVYNENNFIINYGANDKNTSSSEYTENSQTNVDNSINYEDSSNTSSLNAHAHSYAQATCTKPQECSCGATKGEPKGHSYYDQNEICLICGEENPQKSAALASSLTIPNLPLTQNYYGNSGSIISIVNITNIDYEYIYEGKGLISLKIYISGNTEYSSSVDSQSSTITCKIYDSTGNFIESKSIHLNKKAFENEPHLILFDRKADDYKLVFEQ